jgi:hypothetical protein
VSFVSLMLPSGSFLRVLDPKEQANQPAWEKASDAALASAREPLSALAAKLLAHVADSSDIGDPTDPNWLPNLSAADLVVALAEVQDLLASYNRQRGRTTAGAAHQTVGNVDVSVAETGSVLDPRIG